jgi:hypothetical protein
VYICGGSRENDLSIARVGNHSHIRNEGESLEAFTERMKTEARKINARTISIGAGCYLDRLPEVDPDEESSPGHDTNFDGLSEEDAI